MAAELFHGAFTIFLLAALFLALSRAAQDVTYTSADVAAEAHCDGTPYPSLCVATLTAIPDLHKLPLPAIICSAINITVPDVRAGESNCSAYLNYGDLRRRDKIAVGDCVDLLQATLRELRTAVVQLTKTATRCPTTPRDEVMTVLSAAITNQYTCLDGFAYDHGGAVRPYIEGRMRIISRHVSNALAMSKKLSSGNVGSRAEPFYGYGQMVRAAGFPRWVKAGDRRLLQSDNVASTANVTVAKDGSGQFTTVSAAVAAAPNNSLSRYVIYIKAGSYLENVEVGTSKKNILLVGDGIGKTVIKASRNVVDGWTTFRSATVAVVGDGFLARDLTVENAAGPAKHQAVALRVGADLAAFYRCSFVGYQDTLYVHSLRQFFRDCDIYGTVDFIFGNSAVVFQKCNLYARRPLAGQFNVFTAQGREDPNQNTGISVQKCKVAAAADLIPVQANFSTYLGRPWKEYSRTVYLQSFLDSVVAPAGWTPWNGSFALDTLYYGEYANTGPGSNTSARVMWPGYHVITDATVAANFTVQSFIQGGAWLGTTSVPFSAGL